MATITARLADLVGDLVLTSAKVAAVEQIAPGFVRVQLDSPSFRGVEWLPGAKLQLRLQRGALSMRTYTPVTWDAERGVTDVVALTHDHGPGGRWFGRVAVGDSCEVFGPRRSLDLDDLPAGAVFVGDETSAGLAHAMHAIHPAARYVFEADDVAVLTTVLATLGLPGDRCAIVDKDPGRVALLAHAAEAAEAAPVDEPFDVIVSGDAATVHAVRRAARSWPRRPRKVRGKAYWAAGRSGLD